jgi:hypothetical protein
MIISTTLTSGFNGDPYWEWTVKKDIELQDGSPIGLVAQAALVQYGLEGMRYSAIKMSPTYTKLVFNKINQIIFIRHD